MTTTKSKVTAQGQISVPAEVRRQLGVGPGSVLAWEWRDGEFVVRRAGKFSSVDIHAALFGKTTTGTRKTTNAKAGVRAYIRRKHARG